jgi:hypothetical protein
MALAERQPEVADVFDVAGEITSIDTSTPTEFEEKLTRLQVLGRTSVAAGVIGAILAARALFPGSSEEPPLKMEEAMVEDLASGQPVTAASGALEIPAGVELQSTPGLDEDTETRLSVDDRLFTNPIFVTDEAGEPWIAVPAQGKVTEALEDEISSEELAEEIFWLSPGAQDSPGVTFIDPFEFEAEDGTHYVATFSFDHAAQMGDIGGLDGGEELLQTSQIELEENSDVEVIAQSIEEASTHS